MNDLDKKLEHLLKALVFDEIEYSDFIKDYMDSYTIAIKKAFADAGYVPTDVRDKTNALLQDMVNIHTNMKHDMIRLRLNYNNPRYVGPDTVLPPIVRAPDELKAISKELSKPRMTGQEFYERFMLELDLEGTLAFGGRKFIDEAARKAAGIE